MAVVMLDEGASWINESNAQAQAGNLLKYTIRLYVNSLTPSPTNVLADFTQCTLAGYSDQQFDPDYTFPIPTTTGGKAVATPAPVFLTLGPYAGGVTIYGYVVFDDFTGKAIWAEAIAVPIVVPPAGLFIGVQPTLTVGLAA
jgi:hypothetical protein